MFRACMHLRVTSKGVGHGGLTPAGSLLLVGEREPPPGSPVLWDPQVVKWGCLPLFSLGDPLGDVYVHTAPRRQLRAGVVVAISGHTLQS